MRHHLTLEHVDVRYGDTHALNDVSLSLEANKIHGLIGRNGSGKSTLLACIAAFMKPGSGTVLMDDVALFEEPSLVETVALIREGGDTLDEDATIDAALRYAAWFRPHWDAGYADRLVDRFDIPRKTKLSRMSRGQRSSVGIVLGLASRAPLTMFDETYIGMDAPARYAFYDELLRDYVEHPRTIVISSHLVEEVSRLFETVVILHEGRVIAHDNLDVLLQQGASLTGPAETVRRLTSGLNVIGERALGHTLSHTIFGEIGADRLAEARSSRVQVDSVPLQDLFVHLTGKERVA